MGIGNIGKSALQSLTGNIEKAIIEIEDERFRQEEIHKTQVERKKATAQDLGKISGELSKVASKVSETGSVLNKLSVMDGVAQMAEKAVQTGTRKKRFQVKFNPGQVTFTGIGGSQIEKKDYIKSEGKVDISYQEMKPRIEMRMQLIFDDYERTEAFMLEKFTDTTAIARTGVNAVVTATTGKTYSVRPQVEGFMGALRNAYTRKVNFYWGKMKYSGELTDISTEYTMFSTDGNPIRANVNLGILLVDGELSYQSMGQWQMSYQKVFGQDEMTNAGNALQNVGNLLNINL